MDKTTYLNHYYFISVMAFLMIWLPMHRYYSVDAFREENLRAQYIPKWTVDAIKLVLGIVYFYAGLAKINYDEQLIGASEWELALEKVEQKLSGLKKNISVAVMGCVVNGPGEAKEADIGIAGGKNIGLVFEDGNLVGFCDASYGSCTKTRKSTSE